MKTLEAEPQPHASSRPLALTLAALLVLTVVSWVISNLELGWASIAVALAIATIKAGFVLTFFMELPLAATASRVIVIVTLSFIALLCAGLVADIGLR
jgi:cytochrome c oxidase subunit IV